MTHEEGTDIVSRQVRVTPEAERATGIAFLEGASITDIASRYCVSRRAVEAVIREQMRHLIEAKRPEPVPLNVDEVIEAMRLRGLTVEPVQAETQQESRT